MSFDKKLLFSGCSFVAGDELVWDNYCKDILLKNPIEYTWSVFHKDKAFEMLYLGYIDYRKQFNLGCQVGNAFNTPVIDVSMDGNNNTRIALSVIKKLLEKTPEDASQFHVCVGWTSLIRRIIWSKKESKFRSVNVMHYSDSDYSEFHSYIKESIINVTPYDHNLQFIHDVMLLENFLKARGITYTFWLSLSGNHAGGIEDLKETLFPVIPIDKVSERSNWILFNEADPIPMLGTSWTDHLLTKPKPWLSKLNAHPSLASVTEFAESIVSHIQSRFLD
jgi:hypothetical protein